MSKSAALDKRNCADIVLPSHSRAESENMMELDDLNKNPSMKMILLVIEKLHSEITPPPTEMAKNDAAMPSWMRDIHSKLTNPSKSH
jgi:hypothetical protein